MTWHGSLSQLELDVQYLRRELEVAVPRRDDLRATMALSVTSAQLKRLAESVAAAITPEVGGG